MQLPKPTKLYEFQKSLKHFNRCLELTPDHIGSHLMAAVVHEELKHFDQAKALYLSCIDINPDYTVAHINLGMCYLLTGEYKKGWEEYAKQKTVTDTGSKL